MKPFYLACFILFGSILSFVADAQNWNIFPYQQTSYYAHPDTALSPNNFYEYKNDTIAVRGVDSVLFFNRFPIQNNHSMCFYDIKTMLKDTLEFDSLLLMTGKYYYFLIGDTVMFNSLALPGDSWTVFCQNGGGNFDHIIINCDSINVSFIFGVNDSVKYFSLHAFKGLKPINYYNNYTYKLSKDYGLLNFIPFRYLLYHTDSIKPHTYSMRGVLKDSTATLGFKLPTFRDYFFHYHVGDVYAWENSYFITGYGYVYNNSYLDTITKVDTLPNVVKLYFKGTFLGSIDSLLFFKNNYENIIDKTPPHVGFGKSDLYNWGIFKNYISYDSCFEMVLNSLTNSGIDSGCIYSPPFEISSYFNLSSKLGLISNGSTGPTAGFSFYDQFSSILGYRLYNSTYCNTTSFPLVVNEIDKVPIQLSIYPNPFDEQATLIINSALPVQDYTFTLFDVTGRIVKTISRISSSVTTLNRDGLASGIYFYRLTKNGAEISNGKLMVQ